jgi:hypothetical protein
MLTLLRGRGYDGAMRPWVGQHIASALVLAQDGGRSQSHVERSAVHLDLFRDDQDKPVCEISFDNLFRKLLQADRASTTTTTTTTTTNNNNNNDGRRGLEAV